ncbi:MAG TPA: leucyl aminopeptidase [Iamia sp.]|nr:leucyl aminopeptidase [Iamia sp.]
MTPTTAGKVPARTDLVVAGVRSDRLDDDLAAAGISAAFAEASGFTGSDGSTLLAPGAGAKDPDVLAVGLGATADVDANRLRSAAGTAGRKATRHPKVAVTLAERVADGVDAAAATQAVTEGWVLGAYRFDEHRSQPKKSKLASVTLTGGANKAARAAVERGLAVAGAVTLARDLVNQPGGSLVPAQLADRIKAMAGERGLKVRVDTPAQLRKKGLGGVLGVAQGASNEPRFVELTYTPSGRATGHVALVGKGVTFDTGGYSLKTPDGMKGMNSDMGGAAAVVGAMSALAALGAPVKVSGYLPLVENMIGPDAIRVGDVLTIRGGTTVEVLNTDAEGRLILADGLRLASEAKPDAIVDLATLTGAIIAALGPRTAGLFGTDPLVARVRDVADAAGEAVWPMPMPAHLRPGLDSDIADLKNITGGRFGGASVAALFLREFVDDGIPWAHLDIAGPAWITESPYGEVPKLGTGFAVRTLIDLLTTWTPLD